jgi:predicted transcriptional regulator
MAWPVSSYKEDEMSDLRMRFKPAQEGLGQVLGPLESEIMRLVWQQDEATVKQIHRVLARRRDIAYTTVMTTMSRLAEKGFLVRTRRGMAYLYRPSMTKAEFDRWVLHSVLSGLIDTYDSATMDYLVEYLSAERPDQLDHLRAVLDTQRT